MTMPNYRHLPSTVMSIVKNKLHLKSQYLIGVDINQKDKSGNNSLYWAIKTQNIHNAKVLIDHEIDLFVRTGKHAIFCAIENNHYELIILLLQNGISPNITDDNGYTVLMYAIKEEKFRIICLLVRHGAYLFSVDKDNNSIEEYIKEVKSQDIKDFMKHIFSLDEDQKILNTFCNYCEDSKCQI